ncbi:MAG TPA: GumC family protein [Steroidobacteraceae bacterium]|nr:GumC family protein [Steroidobacteraceae bacterium]
MINTKPTVPMQAPPEQLLAGPLGSVAAEDETAGGISVQQIISILRHYWIASAITAVVLIALSFVVIKMLPKSYVATATLIFNYENKDVLAGREFPVGQAGTYIPTQIELILSRVVLEPVVERLKLTSDPEFARGFQGAPGALSEVVTNNLHDILTVQPGTGGQLLYIAAPSKNPERAAQIANAVADEYLKQERERTNAPAAERAERYSKQLQELREKAIQAQDRITEFRQQHELTEIAGSDAGGDAESATLRDLQDKLQSAQNARRELETRQISGTASTDAVLDSGAVSALRSKLATEDGQMADLRATLGPKHPKVIELQSEIEATKRALTNEVQSLSANGTVQLARARELEAKYQTALEAERTRVLDRRGLQDQGAKMLLELQSAQANYRRALDGYDQIMFATAGNYADVSMISRADPPAKPAKPNKNKFFMMACLFSLGVGLIWPFGYELFVNRRLRCRDDMERGFGIPVLAQLGPIEALQA